MAALDRALALAEMHDGAVVVGEHLHLDVARPLDVALEEQPVVAEGAARLARRRRRSAASSVALVAHDAHALAAAAGGGLDQQRIAEPSRRRAERLAAARRILVRGHDRHAGCRRRCARASVLSPIAAIASGVGPMKVRPASCTARAKAAFSARKP